MIWKCWAHEEEDGRFSHIGRKWYVTIHDLDLPIVPVEVEIDSLGNYWGWHATGDEDKLPEMIWKYKGAFSACFPYGPEVEEEKGKGKIVRLTINKIEDYSHE